MRYSLRSLIGPLTIVMLGQSMALPADSAVEPIYLYGSQTGKPTFDQDQGGGNPFASALVELLARDSLTFEEFSMQLVDLTKLRSKGLQEPDVLPSTNHGTWRFLPKPSTERRVALVLVFSDYSASDTEKSLPGAKHDLKRISDALDKAGFEVEAVLDPDRSKVEIALREFADSSEASEVALLYTTGHGVEVEGSVYLLPTEYPFSQGGAALNEHGVLLTALGSAVRASQVNLVFYGGCRNNPFSKR